MLFRYACHETLDVGNVWARTWNRNKGHNTVHSSRRRERDAGSTHVEKCYAVAVYSCSRPIDKRRIFDICMYQIGPVEFFIARRRVTPPPAPPCARKERSRRSWPAAPTLVRIFNTTVRWTMLLLQLANFGGKTGGSTVALQKAVKQASSNTKRRNMGCDGPGANTSIRNTPITDEEQHVPLVDVAVVLRAQTEHYENMLNREVVVTRLCLANGRKIVPLSQHLLVPFPSLAS